MENVNETFLKEETKEKIKKIAKMIKTHLSFSTKRKCWTNTLLFFK